MLEENECQWIQFGVRKSRGLWVPFSGGGRSPLPPPPHPALPQSPALMLPRLSVGQRVLYLGGHLIRESDRTLGSKMSQGLWSTLFGPFVTAPPHASGVHGGVGKAPGLCHHSPGALGPGFCIWLHVGCTDSCSPDRLILKGTVCLVDLVSST